MTEPSTQTPPLPLFYREPTPLSAGAHGDLRLVDGDVSFAAHTPCVPIVVGEVAQAARCYPVVFAAGDAQPIAVTGLEQRNLFVEDGRWLPGTYMPAYVRRYPFGFIATSEPEGFVLAIDAGCDRLVQGGEEGAALFEDGQPSGLTSQALDFCNAFQAEAIATAAFAQALLTQDLLVDRRADATLPDGRTLGLDGFQVVDPERFGALADDVVAEWHRKGWLGLIHHHLSSLDRFAALLDQQAARGAVAHLSQ